MRMSFVARLLVNAGALWVATRIVPGVEYSGGWIPFFGVALVFGVVNTFVGTATKILTLPLILLTLGLFLLVVNGLMLWLTGALAGMLGLGFHVSGFWAAFWGGLVVSIVGTAGALGDAGSPASDSTLGPTSGLNVDGQHNHIWDTVVPTFLHYNLPLLAFGWVAAMVL